MKFVVITGAHSRTDGTLILAGEPFDDDNPLHKMFPGKIKLLSEKPSQALTDSHRDAIAAMTPTKPPILTEDPIQADSEPATEAADKPKKEKKVKYRTVNKEFDFDPKATGLQVKKAGVKYFVFDDSDKKNPLNAEGLKKAEVLPFIKSQCEE